MQGAAQMKNRMSKALGPLKDLLVQSAPRNILSFKIILGLGLAMQSSMQSVRRILEPLFFASLAKSKVLMYTFMSPCAAQPAQEEITQFCFDILNQTCLF